MNARDFNALGLRLDAARMYKSHHRRSGLTYYAFIRRLYDDPTFKWEVHTYSTGLQLHCTYKEATFEDAVQHVYDFLD